MFNLLLKEENRMKKLLLLLLVGSVGGALAVDRDAARDLLKRYDAARIQFGDAIKCAEPAFAAFSNAVAELFVMDIGLNDPIVKNELEQLATGLDNAQIDAWSALMNAAMYNATARALRSRLVELTR